MHSVDKIDYREILKKRKPQGLEDDFSLAEKRGLFSSLNDYWLLASKGKKIKVLLCIVFFTATIIILIFSFFYRPIERSQNFYAPPAEIEIKIQ